MPLVTPVATPPIEALGVALPLLVAVPPWRWAWPTARLASRAAIRTDVRATGRPSATART